MVADGKPSLLIVFSVVVATCNALIVLGTLRRVFHSKDLESTYTYLDIDYPIEMPVGIIPTVEMTFHESSRFRLSDNDSQINWGTLVHNDYGTGFHHLGPYHFRFISGAYHSLHCAYKMQIALDKPQHLEHPDHHFAHCLMYLKQIFLCNADLTLEHGDFMARNVTTDRIWKTRRCRDWETVASWLGENFKEWANYNGVSLDK